MEGSPVVEDGLVAIGRLVEQQDLLALGDPVAASSVSSVAVREKLMTGLTKRQISSAMVANDSGSSRSRRHWSGNRLNAHMPPEMALRVVSLPATSRITRNMVSSSW